ncbi:hypothetical protein K1T71_003530 [Dendrolimus kikuchii]|uniref:Uncharacterized protein n=1 Tax=Dendrolimus kikuchii TaxID=765133 RepID=A0ACC1DC99_9NEOP|nr:hypothetical protein K1T71_003530 [Dendrolimus kikuchii]
MEEIAREYISYARQLSTNSCYSKAFDLFIMAFEKCPGMKTTHEPEFRMVLTRLNEVLAAGGKMEDIFSNFGRAIKEFPNSIYFTNDIGKYLYKFGFYTEAWCHFQKALNMDSGFVNAEKNLNSVKNLLVERWHFRMLNDRIRNEAYHSAIYETMLPFVDTVLDLGTGTGLLAMYAHERTPIATTACDGSEVMTKLASTVTMENDIDNIVVVNKLSTSMDYKDIGGKRSLLITELFDAGLFGEHILQTLSHAWEYLINNVGRVLPNRAEFFVVGAQCDRLHKKYQLSSSIKAVLNIPNLRVHILTYDETYDCEDVHLFKDITYVTEPESLLKIDFNNYNDIQDKLTPKDPYKAEFKVNQDASINVVIGYFNLYLTDTTMITTNPREKNRANAWQQAVFFDNEPLNVFENQNIFAEFVLHNGKLTMEPNYDSRIMRVSPETIRFLNDEVYINTIKSCIGMASVYLGQIAEMSQISIVDLCPFPYFGLLMLKRGAQSLVCCAKTDSDKKFFRKVFKANKIATSKVTIVVGDEWSQDVFGDEKFHAVFCNILEVCGDIDLRQREMAQHLQHAHLLQGGLFLPAKISMVGQLVSSHWLDINNRVYDENVSNYKIGEFINKYQVSQNFCIDFNHLEYTPLTNPTILGVCNSGIRSQVFNIPIVQNGDANAILCWFSIELMEEIPEISTNRSNSFIDGIAFLANPRVRMVYGQVANILCCADPDGAFKLMIDIEAT